MFFAALTSRLCTAPHLGQVQIRFLQGTALSKVSPQAEQVRLVGV